MNESLRLQPATPEDYDTLCDIGHRAFHADKLAYGQGPGLYEDPTFLLPMLAAADDTVCLLMAGDTAIGITITYQRTPTSRWLGCLCLLPEWQGMGYGGAALRLLEATYPETCQWALDTPAASVRNRHFYEKAGFSEVERTVTDTGFELIVFEKRLP